jgi:hypothetical protein
VKRRVAHPGQAGQLSLRQAGAVDDLSHELGRSLGHCTLGGMYTTYLDI